MPKDEWFQIDFSMAPLSLEGKHVIIQGTPITLFDRKDKNELIKRIRKKGRGAIINFSQISFLRMSDMMGRHS